MGNIFNKFFGIAMGTNVAPYLANLFLAKLEKILQEKTKNAQKWSGQSCLNVSLMTDLTLLKDQNPRWNIGL